MEIQVKDFIAEEASKVFTGGLLYFLCVKGFLPLYDIVTGRRMRTENTMIFILSFAIFALAYSLLEDFLEWKSISVEVKNRFAPQYEIHPYDASVRLLQLQFLRFSFDFLLFSLVVVGEFFLVLLEESIEKRSIAVFSAIFLFARYLVGVIVVTGLRTIVSILIGVAILLGGIAPMTLLMHLKNTVIEFQC